MAGFPLPIQLSFKHLYPFFYLILLINSIFVSTNVIAVFKHNLTAVLNTQRPDKQGRYPVRIRSCVKRKVSYYPTGIMVFKEHWKAGKVIIHPSKTHYNTVIKDKISELEKTFIEQSLSGNDSLKILPDKITSFSGYAEKKIKEWESKESISTIRHKTSYLKKFNDFKKGVRLTDVTPALLQEYENYCRSIGNKHNTIWSAMKFIRTIINSALTDGIISKNPMKGYKVAAFKNPVREYLTQAELTAIEEVAKNCPEPVYRNAANWFLFSCYSGLRYGDVKAFTPAKITGDRIILRTAKAGTDVSIKIHPALKKVIARLGNPLNTLQDYNRSLKVVGVLAKINKRLTSHLGRHTFSIQYLERGGSMENLSKLLGHTNLTTTLIYGKITDKRIDREMDEVWKQ